MLPEKTWTRTFLFPPIVPAPLGSHLYRLSTRTLLHHQGRLLKALLVELTSRPLTSQWLVWDHPRSPWNPTHVGAYLSYLAYAVSLTLTRLCLRCPVPQRRRAGVTEHRLTLARSIFTSHRSSWSGTVTRSLMEDVLVVTSISEHVSFKFTWAAAFVLPVLTELLESRWFAKHVADWSFLSFWWRHRLWPPKLLLFVCSFGQFCCFGQRSTTLNSKSLFISRSHIRPHYSKPSEKYFCLMDLCWKCSSWWKLNTISQHPEIMNSLYASIIE